MFLITDDSKFLISIDKGRTWITKTNITVDQDSKFSVIHANMSYAY
jgi:hypothetical protein